MHIRFDLDFDGECWRGAHEQRAATAGESWVGPLGLLRLLETDLGLGGEWPSASSRIAALAAEVRRREGFWSRSAEVDAIGVASTLLQWRDLLVLAGWRGDGLGQPRLEQLAALTTRALPGVPDRLVAVGRRLEQRACDVARLDVLTAEAELAPLWRVVLGQLAARGVRVCRHALPPVAAVSAYASAPRMRAARPVRLSSVAVLEAPCADHGPSDLARCRRRGFTPRGDGSLQLVRPHGVLQAADEIAAWLAAQPSLEQLVLVGPDEILDAALRRHGLPVTGAAQPVGLLGVLPLVIRAGSAPSDPRVMLELLLLPVSPVRPPLARRLVAALQQWPSTASEAWQAAAADAAPWVADLLSARWPAEGCDLDDVRARVAAVKRWARDLREAPEWRLVDAQCDRVTEMLAPFGVEALPLPQLLRLVDEATAGLGGCAAPAEAGLRSVAAPGAVAGPVDRVVWWNFSAEATAVPRVPFTARERAALTAAGVELPDPAAVSRARAERWRRPLAQAREALVAVCPHRGPSGDALFPHPLWDEIKANLAPGADRTRLEAAVPTSGRAAARVARAARPLPTGRRDWRAPAVLLRLRDEESPTSLGRLVDCSLGWALKYPAGLRAGTTASLSEGNELLGRLAHELMASLFAEGVVSPDEAGVRARAWLAREGPRLAGLLFLPGQERARDEGERAMIEAARDFAALLGKAGAHVVGVETAMRAPTEAGFTLGGRADITLEAAGRRTVVDYKWSGEGYRGDELRAGAAYQLAAYARLAGAAGVAYYVLRDRRLLRTPGAVGDGAPVEGPAVAEMYEAFEAAVRRRRRELEAGRVEAAGHPTLEDVPSPAHSAIVDGVLVLPPSCRFCDFSRLCGLGSHDG